MFSSNKKMHNFAEIFKLLLPHLSSLVMAVILMAIVALTTALYAYLVGPLIQFLFVGSKTATDQTSLSDISSTYGSLSGLSDFLTTSSPFYLGLLIIGVALVKGFAFFYQRVLIIKAGQNILASLRTRMYQGILKMNPIADNALSSGDLVTRFSVDAQIIEQAVTGGAMALVANSMQVLVLSVLALYLCPELFFLALIVFPGVVFSMAWIGKILRKKHLQFFEAYSELGSEIEETLEGLVVINSYNASELAKKRFEKKNINLKNNAITTFSLSTISSPINEILGAVALGITLYYAHIQINSGSLNATEFISFFTALFLLYRPVKGLGLAYHSIVSGQAALERTHSIIEPPNPFKKDYTQNYDTEIINVTAGYTKDEDIVEDLSFCLKKGQKLAITGESGAGKSTILYLVAGYLKPKKGKIQTPKEVALVSQESFLFDDTIAMNILCANPDATKEELQKVCKAAQIHEFTSDFKEGLEYRVGKNGSNLSAGQKQRISIARALISKAQLLLLDEITSALDELTESKLIESMEEFAHNKTIIVVTHRPELAKWANRTIVLKNKKITADTDFAHLGVDMFSIKRDN